jgi:hypothetical protein
MQQGERNLTYGLNFMSGGLHYDVILITSRLHLGGNCDLTDRRMFFPLMVGTLLVYHCPMRSIRVKTTQ